MRKTLVERPPDAFKKYRSVVSIPGLSPEERTSLLAAKCELQYKYFDVKKPWAMQTSKALAQATEEALRLCPFLARFEDSWPLECVLKENHIHRAYEYRASAREKVRGKQRPVGKAQSTGKKRAVRKRAPRKAQSRRVAAKTGIAQKLGKSSRESAQVMEEEIDEIVDEEMDDTKEEELDELMEEGADAIVDDEVETSLPLEGADAKVEDEEDAVTNEENETAMDDDAAKETKRSPSSEPEHPRVRLFIRLPGLQARVNAAAARVQELGSSILSDTATKDSESLIDDQENLEVERSLRMSSDLSPRKSSSQTDIIQNSHPSTHSIQPSSTSSATTLMNSSHELSATQESSNQDTNGRKSLADTQDHVDFLDAIALPNPTHTETQSLVQYAPNSRIEMEVSDFEARAAASWLSAHLSQNPQTPLFQQGSSSSSVSTRSPHGEPTPSTFPAILTFLHSLRPPMDELLPQFVRSGVTDDACLDGLAAMPEQDVQEFMQADVGLNAFQARIVRIALRERAGVAIRAISRSISPEKSS